MMLNHTWMSPKLHVETSPKHGKGVFAQNDIRQGERLAIFGGFVMPIDEINNLNDELCDLPMQIEERFVLASQKSGRPEDTDFFNHSCNPNSGFKGQIFLVAMRNIAKGEEITFDYAMVVSETPGCSIVFEMDCECGAKNCRKKITEQDWKNPELRRMYKGYFSQYLQDKIDLETKHLT
jgi:SET domain-containing protein